MKTSLEVQSTWAVVVVACLGNTASYLVVGLACWENGSRVWNDLNVKMAARLYPVGYVYVNSDGSVHLMTSLHCWAYERNMLHR